MRWTQIKKSNDHTVRWYTDVTNTLTQPRTYPKSWKELTHPNLIWKSHIQTPFESLSWFYIHRSVCITLQVKSYAGCWHAHSGQHRIQTKQVLTLIQDNTGYRLKRSWPLFRTTQDTDYQQVLTLIQDNTGNRLSTGLDPYSGQHRKQTVNRSWPTSVMSAKLSGSTKASSTGTFFPNRKLKWAEEHFFLK